MPKKHSIIEDILAAIDPAPSSPYPIPEKTPWVDPLAVEKPEQKQDKAEMLEKTR